MYQYVRRLALADEKLCSHTDVLGVWVYDVTLAPCFGEFVWKGGERDSSEGCDRK
jgi:hypothetical protein